jgi:hypothetical protein
MKVIEAGELERLVRETFPGKKTFSAATEFALRPHRPVVTFVHGGTDPFLDRHFDDWLAGIANFVPVYQVLNRLCRAGALSPGDYAVTRCVAS